MLCIFSISRIKYGTLDVLKVTPGHYPDYNMLGVPKQFIFLRGVDRGSEERTLLPSRAYNSPYNCPFK